MTGKVVGFHGENRFLSNFWLCTIEVNGWSFRSVEHAYQAAKSLDPYDWAMIRPLTTAQARRYGKRIKIRDDWSQIKLAVMAELVWLKFTQHPDLARKLLATGVDTLIEENYWDDLFWGVCKGQGENHLGRILMNIREKLRCLAS